MRSHRLGISLGFGALLVLVGCASSPPPPEIAQARLAIEDARAAQAETLAAAEYNEATAHWSIADKAWNDKKDGETATHFARLAEAEAREAQFVAQAKTAKDAVAAQTARKAQAELAVRDAQIASLQTQAKTEAERRAAEAEARAAAERRESEARAAAERRESEARLAAERARVEGEAAARTQAAADLARTQAELEATRQAAEAERARLEETRRAEEARTAELNRLRAEQAELRASLAKLAEVRDDPRGLIVTLPGNVYFDVNKSDVKPGMRQRLQEIGAALSKDPNRKILIEGHTDADGSSEYNLQLSRLRSDSVRAILIGAGLPPAQIETTGYGETQPRADNQTASGKAQNRRVEIVIEGTAPVAVR